MPVKQFRDRVALLQSDFLPRDAVCAEVGVSEGEFAEHIIECTSPKLLHLIDIWAGIGACGAVSTTDAISAERLGRVTRKFQSRVKSRQVMIHQGWSASVLSLFPDHYFDWVYIDGDHSYDGVMRDLLAAEPKTKHHLAGHDFASPVDIASVQYPFPGVYTAVMDFCDRQRWRVAAATQVGLRTGDDPDGRNCPSYVLERM